MGKQNFIQGGFTGKVGQLIGARWKDMYIIKANTKPANPKTEKQQANRATFRDRVQSTKLAFQANYDTTLFNSTHVTTWATRMKAASQMYAKDKNILEYCPLIPYGYVPDYPTSDEPEISGNQITLAWDTTDDISGRVLSVLAWVVNDATQKYEAQLIVATVSGAAGSWTATATLPTGYSFDDDTYIIAISRDSTDAENKVLYQPPVHTGSPVPTTVFTLSNPVVTGFAQGDSGYLFTLTPNVTLPDTQLSNVSATCRGVLQGEFVTGSLNNFSFIANGTLNLGDFENLDSLGQRPMFVSGSTLTVSPFSFTAGETRYKFAGATFNLAETPTQQQFIVPAGSFEYVNSDGYRLVNSNTDWTVSGSATIGLRTIFGSNGLQDETYSLSFAMRNGLCLGLTNQWGFSVFYGQNQSATPTGTTTATRNGVTYALPTDTPITVNPEQTSEEAAIDFSNTGVWALDAMFTPLKLKSWGDLPYIYSLRIDLTAYKPDVVELTIDGQSYTTTLSGFGYDGTDAYENCQLEYTVEGNPPANPSAATYKVAWTQEKTYVYTVPNSAGFTFTIHFPVKTYEGIPSIWL